MLMKPHSLVIKIEVCTHFILKLRLSAIGDSKNHCRIHLVLALCLMAFSEAPDLAATTCQKAGEADYGGSHIPIGKARKAGGTAV